MDIEYVFRRLPSANKDAQRIAMFSAAIAQKSVEMASFGEEVEAFVMAASGLIYKWIDRSRKLSLADLFRDPYRELREETRRFAAEWELDEAFRQAMG